MLTGRLQKIVPTLPCIVQSCGMWEGLKGRALSEVLTPLVRHNYTMGWVEPQPELR